VQAAGEAAFVLVAGGLGERLGYSGIKLALPSDTARGACFLQVRSSSHATQRSSSSANPAQQPLRLTSDSR
jgi:UDP-sugar pyrophosphorylase